MRILIVHPGPDFSVHDVYCGWTEALRELGVQVQEYNLNDRLIYYSTSLMPTGELDEDGRTIVRNGMTQEQAFAASLQGLGNALFWFWPDAVIFVSAFFITAVWFRILRNRGIKTVILHTESPYQEEEQLMRAEFADLNLVNDPQNLDKYRKLEGRAEYQHHCYRPSVHHPGSGPRDPQIASDFCFVGTAFESRIRFFEAMDFGGADVMLAGNDWGKTPPDSPLAGYVGTGIGNPDCVSNDQTAELYRNSRMGLNLYRQESAEDWGGQGTAMGPREVEMAACGLPFLRDPRPEGDEILHMLPRFAGPEDASEQLRWWLAHDRERERIAVQAREAAADRTFANSARWLLSVLDKL